MIRSLFISVLFMLGHVAMFAQTVSPLFARGYTVLPEPQTVELGERDFALGAGWRLELDKSVSPDDIAVETLKSLLATRFNLVLKTGGGADGVLKLRIVHGSVEVKNALDQEHDELLDQAYAIDLREASITITANAATGLFYGVETLIQLLRREKGSLWLPEGKIQDWPDLHLRHIFWDDSHHLEPLNELKRNVLQAAFYKINGFVLKLDGHFEYRSAPALVEPYALTPAELQELTDYGLHHHVQVIPYLDGPGHLAFILKHPEYANLREFPASNYEICATNPESYKLLEGMFQDLLDANKGVSSFYLSTDESYYLGLAHSAQCNEQSLAERAGSRGQVFAEYVKRASGYLHDRGRTVIFWGEYPIKPGDIPAFPPYLVNGEVYGPEFDRAYNKQGIRQMIYTSGEGEEQLFPDYFLLADNRRIHSPYSGTPRVQDIINKISYDTSRQNSKLIGGVNASWSDEGVHPETFWLGYAASASATWHPGTPRRDELANTFYTLFYGPSALDMDKIYRLMSNQAQVWTDSWDVTSSTARKSIWGESYRINNPPKPAHDQTLQLPMNLTRGFDFSSAWSTNNSKRIAFAADALPENDLLISMLYQNMGRVQFNRYNIEIYLTIANLCRQNLEMIGGIHRMDAALSSASRLKRTDAREALKKVDQAIEIARTIRQQRNEVLAQAQATWDRSWRPRVADANGRHFLHELDDVKDHLPDRTVDMKYLVYRETLLPFGTWVNSIIAARNDFAKAHHVTGMQTRFAWDDFSTARTMCSSASELLARPDIRPANIDQNAVCNANNAQY